MVDNYELLLNAVVKQAADDYRVALIRQHIGYKETDPAMRISSIERFFKSPEFSTFTKLDGRELIHAIKAEVINSNYDIEKLRENRLLKQGVG